MKRMVRRCGLFVVCMLLIFLSYGQIAKAAITGTEGSSIAGINVEGFARDEIKRLLESEVSSWLQGDPIVLQGEYEQFDISRKAFGFDFDRTLDKWEEETKRSWESFFLKKKHVELPLVVTFKQPEKEALPNRFDKKKVASRLEAQASMLGEKPIEIDYIPEAMPDVATLTTVTLTFPESIDAKASKLARELNEATLKPNEAFSFLEYIGRVGRADQSAEDLAMLGEEADFYATAFYQLVLQSDLQFVEHHSQGSVPSYGETGIEAAVDITSKKDLKVFNESQDTYELQAHVADNQLKLSLLGLNQTKTYEYALSNRTYTPPRTVYQYSDALAPGDETIIQNGQAGVRVKVYRNELNEGDEVINQEWVEDVTYPALPNIKLVSTANSTEDEAVDAPLSDLEDWINEVFEDEETEQDEATNTEMEKAVDALDDQVKKAKQPMIDTYVDALLEAYCEAAVTTEDEHTEQAEATDSAQEKTDTEQSSSDTTEETVEESSTTEQAKTKKFKKATQQQIEQAEHADQVKEIEPVSTAFLDKLESRCTHDREALSTQLKQYLIIESIVDGSVNQQAK